MLRRPIARLLSIVMPCLIAFALPHTVAAQELEEITVTATKRAKSLQEVPLSISAVSGATLEDFAISNFYDMDIPGVNIAQGGMNDNAFIRGIGQSSGNFGFENSAPYYIDGVYFGRARGTRLAWLDTDRIEILKGPVPTYLGKNASAGGISILSRRPTDAVEGYVDVLQEFEHNELAISGAISGPISDTFRVRLAGKYRDLKDGWMVNTVTNVEEPKQEDTLARLSFDWDMSDSLSMYAKLESVSALWDGRNSQQYNCTPTAPIDPAVEDCLLNSTRALFFDPVNHPTGIWDRDVPAGTNFNNDFDYTGGAVVLDWDIEAFTLTSTTAYYEFTNTLYVDFSQSSFDRALANMNEEFDQFSQEVRLTSAGGGSIEWLAGVYYDTNNNKNWTRNSIPAAMGMVVFMDNDETADSWAVFGEIAFDLSDEVRATVGGRYSDYEKNNVYQRQVWAGAIPGQPYTDGMVVGPATFTIPNSQGDSKFQPAIGLEWRPSDETMYYVSAKEGFKAGGLDQGTAINDADLQRIAPEEVTAFELGARWTLAGGAARLNASLFHASYDDLQVALYDPIEGVFVTSNAGAATTQGLEVDADWAITDNLELGVYLSFLDGKYDDYKGVACYLNPPQTEAQGCVELPDANGDPSGTFGQDLSGTPLQFAPDFSSTVTLKYNKLFGNNLEFFGTLSVFMSDGYQITADGDPDLTQGSYSKIDARLGIGAADGRWSLAAIGRNLNDEDVIEWASNTPFGGGQSNFGLLKRSRQLAVQGVYRWGD